jgi:L-ascorbate metabolism protein UlaG (beta-lactamase superfamily)
MHMTKLGHSCVRVKHRGGTLVVDPGVFSDRGALDGADAVLITHQHDDHLDEALLRAAAEAAPELEIWGPPSVAAILADLGARVHAARPGEQFEAAGVGVRVLGDLHAPVHSSLPQVENNGYLFEGSLFHPGDSLTVPDEPVANLLVPAAAPWVKVGELADYVMAVAPQHSYLIHDSLLSPTGLALYHRVLSGLAGAPGQRTLEAPAPGTGIELVSNTGAALS